ncbi:xanthine dehydrogenase small subunit [Aliagarivorans taiwanensis]|uniref:xanthine dehydrogenase small subunit n=1 Tax=Aliagarivorans taiwanensis TaxID=561966 RepID=UPI00040A2245|nr:xanthine dehydrogenase small subunit [Aliagarivorans taiwanensis]
MLQIMINQQLETVADARADTMLLTYLREQMELTGSKEGCASGDCGACTVVVVELDDQQQLRYRQINACITPLHALHGKQVITVEQLKNLQANQLHPVQQAVVDKHGSQCGFCTPGIIMSLYALSKQRQAPAHPAEYLAGNLCRCTGYGPLIEAANDVAELAGVEYFDPAQPDEAAVKTWQQQCTTLQSGVYHRPQTRSELTELRAKYPEAQLIAGGTDLALEITQQLKDIEQLIDMSAVDDLQGISETEQGWRVGAALPLDMFHEFMREHFPSTDELIERLGSLTIRRRGTLGGSLGHASPIGDIAPLLISLGGSIEIDDGTNRQLFAPEDYITGYRQTRLQNKQWISAVHLPRPQPGTQHAIYKVSKRFEDDIATVVLALSLRVDDAQRVKHCIISAGGIAAKSVRLRELEALLLGQPFNQISIDKLKAAVPLHISPLSDVRASAEYRVQLVQNLLQRFYLESQQITTRLTDYA